MHLPFFFFFLRVLHFPASHSLQNNWKKSWLILVSVSKPVKCLSYFCSWTLRLNRPFYHLTLQKAVICKQRYIWKKQNKTVLLRVSVKNAPVPSLSCSQMDAWREETEGEEEDRRPEIASWNSPKHPGKETCLCLPLIPFCPWMCVWSCESV